MAKLRKGGPQPPTEADWKAAASDAELLMEQSPVLRSLLVLAGAFEAGLQVTHNYMLGELQHGWEVSRPNLVLAVLQQAARGGIGSRVDMTAVMARLDEYRPIIATLMAQESEHGNAAGGGSESGEDGEAGDNAVDADHDGGSVSTDTGPVADPGG